MQAAFVYEFALSKLRLQGGVTASAIADLARIRVEQGHLEEAENLYRQALDLQPGFVSSLRALPSIIMARGNVQTALEMAAVRHEAGVSPSRQANNVLWLAEEALMLRLGGGNHSWTQEEKSCSTQFAQALQHTAHMHQSPSSQQIELSTELFDQSAYAACCPRPGSRPTDDADENQHENQLVTSFLSELYVVHAQLGVFLDELGAFSESIAHFRQAFAMCGPASGLMQRVFFSLPTVQTSHHSLEESRSVLNRAIQGLLSAEPSSPHFPSPEGAIDMRWTLTPPSMFVWYQFHDLQLLQNMNRALLRHYPSLAMTHQAHDSEMQEEAISTSKAATRVHVGFVSSFLRQHSVGKLSIGLLQGLDRSEFEVTVFVTSHFFDPEQEDPILSAAKETADNFVVLNSSLKDASQQVLGAHLDVLAS
jgi:hypothetical protein